jgi:hypothetical protein
MGCDLHSDSWTAVSPVSHRGPVTYHDQSWLDGDEWTFHSSSFDFFSATRPEMTAQEYFQRWPADADRA